MKTLLSCEFNMDTGCVELPATNYNERVDVCQTVFSKKEARI